MTPIALTRAREDDCIDLLEWRNHPDARKNFFDDGIFSQEEHKTWFCGKLKDSSAKIYVARSGDNKVGVIRFEMKRDFVDVSVNVNPLFFRQGFGSEIIRFGTERFYDDVKYADTVVARIKKDNIASQKAFSKAGYICVEEKDGRVVYKKESR